MLHALKNLFGTVLGAPGEGSRPEQDRFLQLATAVLLIEVMRADREAGVDERLAVVRALRDKFSLGDFEVSELLRLAEQSARSATEFSQFTSAIDDGFDQEQKARIIENMWRVAFADGHLNSQESQRISRIAGLLHVPQAECLEAMMRAREGGAEGPL
jgi:uncharacterized tellurite resistance protein B-like protein